MHPAARLITGPGSSARIGLNLLYLLPGVVGGTETYAAGLLHGLAEIDSDNTYVIFVSREAAAWPLPARPNFQRVVCEVAAMGRMARYRFEQLSLPRLLQMHRVDLIHSLGYVGPLRTACPSIVSVPDLNYRAFGAQMPRWRRWALAFFVGQSARRARRVITVSQFSATQLVKVFKLPPERVTVTYLAARADLARGAPLPERPRQSHQGTHPYILAFSSNSPNKNIPRLVEAYRLARRHHHVPQQLVLVGHPPDTPLALADPAIHAIGYVDEVHLAELLVGADLLVFPSLYEGFGLPVLEAMACGVPVVCSNRASLPEVAGEAALFFDPTSVEEMAGQIAKAALDSALRDTLRAKGHENLRRFSWEQTARATLAIYAAVLSDRTH